MHRPERTCIGCRGRDDQAHLIRLVNTDGAITLDLARTASGRGAYLHPSDDCVRLALRRRSLGRALRAPVDASRLTEVMGPALAGDGDR